MSDPPTPEPADPKGQDATPANEVSGEDALGPEALARTLESAVDDAVKELESAPAPEDEGPLDRPTIPRSMPLPGFGPDLEAGQEVDSAVADVTAEVANGIEAGASLPKPPARPSPPPPEAAGDGPGAEEPPPAPSPAPDPVQAARTDEAVAPEQGARAEQPSMPDDDPVAEQGPPGIPSLVQPEVDEDRPSEPTRPRKRGRKGKRRTVTIPDDAVPATPAPAAAQTAPSPAPPQAAESPPPPQATVEQPSAAESASPPAPEVRDEGDAADRESAPGIFTDEQAIAVLRPIQVVSDLPPVAALPVEVIGADDAVPLSDADLEPAEGSQPEGGAASSAPLPASALSPTSGHRPPPPKRSDRPDAGASLDNIEEVIPDRMSLPGLVADPVVGAVDSSGAAGETSQRRPLPPPRGLMSSDPNLMLGPEGTPQPAAPVIGGAPAFEETANNEAEVAAAAAEAAAREAEALAREAEARAQEAELKAAAARSKAAERAKRPWWVRLFEDEFISTLDNPKKKDVRRETDFIEKSLRLDHGSRVLDLACGHGVYAVELASRGYQLVGVDLSPTMLALANEYNTKRSTSVSFIQGDMRKLALDGVFDGIFCWSSSFGYFDDHHNREVLKRVARALRPGGRFVLDVINRDFVAPRSPSMAWFEKPGCVCMDEMRFDFFTSRLMVKRMVMFETGRSTEIETSMRLYPLNELGRMLQTLNLKVLEVSGHRAHRNAYFGCESPRVIITSERIEDAQ